MILSEANIKKYIPLRTSSMDINQLESFENRALYKYFPQYIGMDLVDDIAGDDPDDDLLVKVKPVLANLTYLEATPFLDVVSTTTGFGVIRNNNVAPASIERVKALKQGCLQAANDFMDQLLYFLEENQNTYTDWNKSSLNEGSLIINSAVCTTIANKEITRPRFIKLIPHIAKIEYTKIYAALSSQFLVELQAGSDAIVKPDIQKALFWFAIAELEENNSKKMLIIQTANQHLNKALAYLKNHLTDYVTYSSYGYEAPYDNDDDDFEEEPGFFVGGLTG